MKNKGNVEYVITLTIIACLFIVEKFDLLAKNKLGARQFAIIYAFIDYSVKRAQPMFCNYSLF